MFRLGALCSSGKRLFVLVHICCLLLGGCAANTEPQCETWVEGAYLERPISVYEVSGKRDGATTRALATLTLAGGEKIQIALKVDYDPQPVLGGGNWRLEGANADSGTVRAESLRFLGGQSEGPSLGGRFRLEAGGQPRFRVVLPLRVLAQANWQKK